ncbi:hypothetical protein MICAK_1450015 [Microcystis aeruginosa PCC 9701]|uniref:Uncharacterized protein n=1 Tax=Microcystis aeruginosa PCC 9701 TaxID=721123 RepID=I4ILV7_MICAE|nr:hypothetical protein MICAK_1450015 [Microcystis aeruginosa PCC 9701]
MVDCINFKIKIEFCEKLMFTGAKPLKLDLTKDLRLLYSTGNKLLHERATPHAPIISFILPEYQTRTRNLLLGRDYCGGDIR